jgi:hypothetical protein
LTKWKRAVSTLVTAGLLASLLSSAFATSAFANTSPQALDTSTCVPAGCTQVAASGFIQISSTADTFPAASAVTGGARKLTITGSGATFIDADGNFALQTGTLVEATGFYLAGEVKVATGVALNPAADSVKVTGATAGTATITEWLFTGSSGSPANTWVPDGNTWTVTFTAAANFQVSAANSTVATYSDNACTTASSSGNTSTAGTTVGYLGVTTRNANNDLLSGVTVSGSIQPFGTISGAQTYSATTVAGKICLPIISAGLSGTSTITASALYLGVTTPLASKTFTFAGPIATLTASPDLALAGNDDGTIKVTGKDANGNSAVLTGVTATLSSGLAVVTALNTGTGNIVVECVSATAQSKETVVFKSGSITSNTVNVYCTGGPFVTTGAKLTIKPATASIPAGGSTTFTATIMDAAGFPIADGADVTGLASAGLVIGDGTSGLAFNQAETSAGVATFTYYAQNTTGPVTLTGVGAGLSGAGTITVGPSTPTSNNANKLGLPSSTSSYSTATKVQVLNRYVTWRANVGAANSGKSVGVYVATKNAAGVWSAFTRVTGRAAAADGSVVYYARRSSAAWISVRFSLDGVAFSNAVQARWR